MQRYYNDVKEASQDLKHQVFKFISCLESISFIAKRCYSWQARETKKAISYAREELGKET